MGKQRGGRSGESSGSKDRAAPGSGEAARQTKLLFEERHEPIQAVVLADSFETRFEPFTTEKPRCLLPLVNRPLIDYTLESLESAGVEEIIMYSGAHADQLERYLDASKWRSPHSPFSKFRFIRSTSTSVGEAMRDLHGKHLMAGDFIIVHGDVVSNYPIEEAIKAHKARRTKDKNAIMTMVLREIGPQHRTKSSPNTPVFVVDPLKDRCLHYEEISQKPRTALDSPADGSSTFLSIDPEFTDYVELDIRNDLYDCGIDICTPEVLGLWADSFDYQSPRSQFLHGVLKDYELNGVTIHTHVVRDYYAARVHNLKAYDAVSKDIITRWTYPFCPDMNLGEDECYTFKRRQLYLDQDVNISRLATIRRDTVVGSQSSIGDNTVVSDSVIGKNCHIGNNVTLENAYIWDGAIIGDDTEIKNAVVADGAVIGGQCRLEPGSLVSYGVRVADGITISKGLRITKGSTQDETPSDAQVVGDGGEGHEFIPEEEEDEGNEDPVLSSLMYNMAELSLSSDSISTLASQAWDEDSSEKSRTGSFSTSLNEEDAFHHDAVTSILDGLKEGLASDLVHLELVGLRMSANASEHHVRSAVVTAFMARIQQLIDEGSSAGDAVNKILAKYKEVIDRIVFDRDRDDKPDQVDLLLLFQKDIAERTKGGTILLFAAKELYDLEIVDEEAFSQWWEHEESTSTEPLTKVREQTQPFIDWLASAESDSDDDEEEESESEEELSLGVVAVGFVIAQGDWEIVNLPTRPELGPLTHFESCSSSSVGAGPFIDYCTSERSTFRFDLPTVLLTPPTAILIRQSTFSTLSQVGAALTVESARANQAAEFFVFFVLFFLQACWIDPKRKTKKTRKAVPSTSVPVLGLYSSSSLSYRRCSSPRPSTSLPFLCSSSKTPFTTSPITRKRKAGDAADEDVDAEASRRSTSRSQWSSASTPDLSSNNVHEPRAGTARSSSESRSESVSATADAATDVNKDRVAEVSAETDRDAVSASQQEGNSEAVAGSTDKSPVGNMDSDDEFMSDGASSVEDILDTQGSDDESMGEEFGDDMLGSFSDDREPVKPVRKPYEVEHKALSPEEIDREQSVQINEVSSILGLSAESAAILLRYSRWNREKLIETYMDHPDETMEEAGLGSDLEHSPKIGTVPGFVCEVCYDEGDDVESYAMRCGHRFCLGCYNHYVSQKIREEGEAARIECPQENCHRIVDSKSMDLLVGDHLKDRYQTLLTRSYVDDKDNLKWCPAPNCEYAIDCPVKRRNLNRIVPTVRCACSHEFCFGCTQDDHQPTPCVLVSKWLQKCKDDSETANWISANTKECPKCHSTIEKNGGCNHMTCRKCRHEFCWMCMGLWSEHGTSWYSCNRFEEKSGSAARDAQARSRKSLERYLHYYNRYANHEQSAKLDKGLYLKTERKMTSLQSSSGLSWIEVQFLDTASRTLQQCRQTLKWTYAFAFYLARNNLTEIFEDNQRDLEMAVEALSEMFEKPVEELAKLKVDILDKTTYCNKRRVILLSDTAQSLEMGEWEFNIDLDKP